MTGSRYGQKSSALSVTHGGLRTYKWPTLVTRMEECLEWKRLEFIFPEKLEIMRGTCTSSLCGHLSPPSSAVDFLVGCSTRNFIEGFLSHPVASRCLTSRAWKLVEGKRCNFMRFNANMTIVRQYD